MPSEWKKFLSVGKNKENLLGFLSSQWSCVDPIHLPRNLAIYVGQNTTCVSLKNVNKSIVVDRIESLCCDHEEADTRMLLHAKHASEEGFHSVAIRTPDTDVIVILVGLQSQILCGLYVETGVGDRKRLIDVEKVSDALTPGSQKALIGFHAFTGENFESYYKIV